MNTLRAILSCLLVLSLLVSTSGVSLVHHICSSEEGSEKLVNTLPSDACECDHDDATTPDAPSNAPCAKDCCHTTLHTLKITDAFTLATLPNATPKITLLTVLPALHLMVPHTELVFLLPSRPNASPPPYDDIPVRFHALLI